MATGLAELLLLALLAGGVGVPGPLINNPVLWLGASASSRSIPAGVLFALGVGSTMKGPIAVKASPPPPPPLVTP